MTTDPLNCGKAGPDREQVGGGALSGVLVADFSRVLAGPLASMFLADLGADVIKVERPGAGDDTRLWGPPYAGTMSTYFMSVNRNKRSVALDLGDPEDLALARALIRRADVVIENFRPGALSRFGLDAQTVTRSHPHVVYCSISGYGSDAGAHLAGYDFVIQAVGGLMSVTGSPAGEPMKAGVALVDVLTGLHATIGILAALHDRARTGRGQVVEVNLLSSLLSSLVNQASAYLNADEVPSRKGNAHPSIAPYETLRACDADLAVAVGNDRQFRLFAEALGKSELADDPQFVTNAARVVNREILRTLLESELARETAAHWTEALNAVGVPCGPVHDIPQAIALAERLGLDPVVVLGDSRDAPPARSIAAPIRMSATPPQYHRPPPEVGADTAEVRAWLKAERTHRTAPDSDES
jgi:crotonobetainyl-CoA:carnitine CoA-transferase CaiB-like acyl-CoA transferase